MLSLIRGLVWLPFMKSTLPSTTDTNFQFSSVMSDSLRPHELQHARLPCLSPTPGVHSNSHPSSQWCHPAISSCRLLLLLPPIPPSIRVFSNESTLSMRWPKYWSFSFSIISSKEHPGLISFRMDCLDLLAVQGTLKSLLQHHSSKASDQIRSDQLLSHVRLFAIPWIAACQASLSITNSRSSLKLMAIESVMPSSHLIFCRSLLLLPSIFPSIRVLLR